MPAVEIRFTAVPAHVRTARLIAAAVARRAGIENGLLDEIRLAVGEACSRAVGIHQRIAAGSPVTLTISEETDELVVSVADEGADPVAAPEDALSADPFDVLHAAVGTDGEETLPDAFGLSVIAGLADDVDVLRAPGGTVVRMRWKIPGIGGPPASSAAAVG